MILVSQTEAVQARPHSENYGARYEAPDDKARVASSPQSLFQNVAQQYRLKSSSKEDNAPEKWHQWLSFGGSQVLKASAYPEHDQEAQARANAKAIYNSLHLVRS